MSYEEHHSAGYHVHTRKLTVQTAIRVPSTAASAKTWYDLDTWREGELEPGKTTLTAELGWNNPTIKPKDIKAEWVRLNEPTPTDDDPTGRAGLVVGSETAGADLIFKLEDVKPEDLPMTLRAWQVRGSTGVIDPARDDVLFTKIIMKAHNTKAEIAGDLS